MTYIPIKSVSKAIAFLGGKSLLPRGFGHDLPWQVSAGKFTYPNPLSSGNVVEVQDVFGRTDVLRCYFPTVQNYNYKEYRIIGYERNLISLNGSGILMFDLYKDSSLSTWNDGPQGLINLWFESDLGANVLSFCVSHPTSPFGGGAEDLSIWGYYNSSFQSTGENFTNDVWHRIVFVIANGKQSLFYDGACLFSEQDLISTSGNLATMYSYGAWNMRVSWALDNLSYFPFGADWDAWANGDEYLWNTE